jgi:ankyrin repeat protein
MNGFTALHSAAVAGNIQAVTFLLEKDARVDVTNSDLDLPLHLASR